jgi:hypothetical protein
MDKENETDRRGSRLIAVAMQDDEYHVEQVNPYQR